MAGAQTSCSLLSKLTELCALQRGGQHRILSEAETSFLNQKIKINPVCEVTASPSLRLLFPKLWPDQSAATMNNSFELGRGLATLREKGGVTCCESSLKMVARWRQHKGCLCMDQHFGPCGWDKMYSDSTTTIWVISPHLIPLHLVRSDFIHLQIAMWWTVFLRMEDKLYSLYSLPFYNTLAFDEWGIQNIVHRAIVLNS